MKTLAQLAKEHNTLEQTMLKATLEMLALDPRNPKRLELKRKRDEIVTAWALAGRDLDYAIKAELGKGE